MSDGMGMRSFLKHSGNAGGKREYLTGWKETREGAITVWLHKRAGITALWRHQIPGIETREDKDTHTKHTEIWSSRHGCYEDEEVLRYQGLLDDDGLRRTPPKICGVCRFTEWVRAQVTSGAMPLAFPLLTFESTGGKDRKLVIPAAGVFDGFRKISDAEKAQVKEAGFWLKDSYRYDLRAKLQYAFIVVNEDDPKKGIQIAVEGQLLGQKMQTAIRKEMQRKGDDEGDPTKFPYAFRWEYFKDSTDIRNLYDATVLDRVKLTPVVAKLLDEDPPDISSLCQKLNPMTLQARFQKHIAAEWRDRVPWSELFGPNIDAFNRASTAAPANSSSRAPEVGKPADPFYDGVVPVKKVAGKIARVDAPARPFTPLGPSSPLADALAKAGYSGQNWAEPKEEDPGAVACDKCDRGIFVDWPVCPFCGTVYAAPEPAPPPPKKFPSRAEMASRKQESHSPAQTGSAGVDPNGFSDEEDGVPFIRNEMFGGVWWKP